MTVFVPVPVTVAPVSHRSGLYLAEALTVWYCWLPVAYRGAACLVGELSNQLPKQVVVGLNLIARSKPHFVRAGGSSRFLVIEPGKYPTCLAVDRLEGLERHALPSPFVYLMKVGGMEAIKIILAGLSALTVSSCHYYEEYRVLKSTADLQDERTELLKAYRLCLTKYQDEPPKAKEICGPYTQSLREIEVKQQRVR